MDPRQRNLAILNLVGGTAVLGSYGLAFAMSPDIRSGLWGGVPEAWRGFYTVCMLLAATGYFPFTFLWIFRTDPAGYRGPGGLGYGAVVAFYAAVLLPSAAWLPLTALLLDDFSTPLWWLVRGVLFAVGLGASGLVVLCAARARQEGGALRWAAFAGTLPFWVQTAWLDAVIWPAYFPTTL
ncbi:MAG: hypothetical protein ACQGVK_12190 [Myxococcota bacterium]